MVSAQRDFQVGHGLLERLTDARRRTDDLFTCVRSDSLYERPVPERHRIVFYIGHLEAFDWNLFRDRAVHARPFSPEFDKLFAFGIDPVGGGLPTDRPADWPPLTQVLKYVSQVRLCLDEGLKTAVTSGEQPEFPADRLLNVAIEHRLMHAETLAYMFHQLPLDRKIKMPRTHAAPALAVTSHMAVTPHMVEVPAGTATLGLPRDAGVFGWDNEYEAHVVEVPAFAIDQHKVTNGQYLEFMTHGGYENPVLWTEEDWKWKTEANITHPAFWKRDGGLWYFRTMFDEVRLPYDWPVYVSHAEASAYARWAGKSLPTEAQWHRAAYGESEGLECSCRYPWGDGPATAKRGNFDFEGWDPVAVTASPEGRSTLGIEGLLGNGWEWTSTVFAPFPGFQRFSFYPGYSADFFDGKHYILKGGSARTAACMLRRSFRNWFQPHYQYVYSGFRCVTD